MIQPPRARLAVPQSPEQHLSTVRKNQKGQSPGFCSGFAVLVPQPQNQKSVWRATEGRHRKLLLARGKGQKAPRTGSRPLDIIRAALQEHRGSLTPTRPALQPLREALYTPSISLTSTQVSISENWFMMGRITSMELPTCRSDLFPTKIMGILGKTQSTSEATPLLVPALSGHWCFHGQVREATTPLCKVQSSFPASHSREHPSGETACPILLMLSPSNNMLPLIQHSSLLPKRSTHRLKLLCIQIPLAATSPCLTEKRSRGEKNPSSLTPWLN